MDAKTIVNWLYSAMSAPTVGVRSNYLTLVETAMPHCQCTGEHLMSLLAKNKTKPELYRILSEYGF
jgi:hypothetical protein